MKKTHIKVISASAKKKDGQIGRVLQSDIKPNGIIMTIKSELGFTFCIYPGDIIRSPGAAVTL